MNFVNQPQLNLFLQLQYDRLRVPLEHNTPELLYEVTLLFCRVGIACGHKTRWPGTDLRLALLNQCYSYIYRPLKEFRSKTSAIYMEYGGNFTLDDENSVDDIRRRICLLYNTRLWPPRHHEAFYTHNLNALAHEWVLSYAEWTQMWQLLARRTPNKCWYTTTSTGRYFASAFELVDEPEGNGFSIIQVHWKKRNEDNLNFNIELILDVVPQGQAQQDTICALHAAIAQRYPKAVMFVDVPEAVAPVYRRLGYTEVPSLADQMNRAYGTDTTAVAFLCQFQ